MTPEEYKKMKAGSTPASTTPVSKPSTAFEDLKAASELQSLERGAAAAERKKQREYQALLQKQGIILPEEQYKPYEPPVAEDFTPTLPYAFAPAPAQPVTRAIEPIGITGALRPQTAETVNPFAPGAGLPAEERAKITSAYAQEVAGKRKTLEEQLVAKGKPVRGKIKPEFENMLEMGQVPPASAYEYTYVPITREQAKEEAKKRYPEGFVPGEVLESPVSWAARVLTAPQNAAAGAIGYLLTPGSIQQKKEAQRPPGLRQPGIAGNIAAAIASPGVSGLSEQAYDAFSVADNPKVKALAPLAGSVEIGRAHV